MVDELTLRDVLQQMGEGLGRVEEDVRGSRTEMREQIGALRVEMRGEMGGLRTEMGGLRAETERRFRHLYGLLVVTLLSVVTAGLGVAGLWIKM